MNHDLTHYVGRPSPLYFAERLTEHLGGAKIYLKRDELNHTGAHKVNNVLGQILLARRMGKKRIIAETGAGQHGVATATLCARFGLDCIVYMGAVDVERQKPNVFRMKMLGAEVVPVQSGSRTLKDAMNEALRDWVTNVADHLLLHRHGGRARIPIRPWCAISNASSAARRASRCMAAEGRLPDSLIAAIGGGSNAIGLFHPFLDDRHIEIYRRRGGRPRPLAPACMRPRSRAAGRASCTATAPTCFMDEDGQIAEAHSISAGLDYPGIGPEHSWLHDIGRVTYLSATDEEALAAFQLLSKLEGIIPALEPAHALAKVIELAPEEAQGPPHGDESVRPRRQGHFYRRGASSGWDCDHPHRGSFRRAAAPRDAPRSSPYVMAGDPDPETSLAILKGLPAAGADIVEFGLPFTDPMADGPPIQAAGLRALKAGQTTARTLELVREFRKGDADTPVILMGYYNPIYIYGVERFLVDAKSAGVDGLIVVDLPPEEDAELCLPALKAGLAFIRLATPTTDDKRLPAVLENTAGLRLLRVDHRHHGRGDAGFRQGRRRRRAHQAPYGPAGRGRLRRQDRRPRRRHRAGRRRGRGRLGLD